MSETSEKQKEMEKKFKEATFGTKEGIKKAAEFEERELTSQLK